MARGRSGGRRRTRGRRERRGGAGPRGGGGEGGGAWGPGEGARGPQDDAREVGGGRRRVRAPDPLPRRRGRHGAAVPDGSPVERRGAEGPPSRRRPATDLAPPASVRAADPRARLGPLHLAPRGKGPHRGT